MRGAGDGQVFFCNSGAEANEAAIKLSRKFGGRGRHVMVTAYGSFHGRTLGALALTGQPAKHEIFQPMPEGFRYCEFGDIASLEAQIDDTVSAVMLESIQGEGELFPLMLHTFKQFSLCVASAVFFSSLTKCKLDSVVQVSGLVSSMRAFSLMQ